MRRTVLLAVTVLALGGATRADAAERVVGTVGDVEVRLDDASPDQPCLRIERRGEEDPNPAGVCSGLPRSRFSLTTVSGLGVVAYLVPPGVATVARDGESLPTTELPGIAARVAVARAASGTTLLRYLDAAGVLYGAAVDDGEAKGSVVFRSREGTIRARRGLETEPTPLRLDRTEATTCLDDTYGLGGQECAWDGRTLASAEVESGCRPDRGVLHGLLPASAARVRVVFGNDRTRTVAARPLPAGSEGTLLALRLPRGLAVRRVDVLDGSGKRLDRLRLGAPPTGGDCDRDGFRSGFFSGLYRSEPPRRPIAAPVAAMDGGLFVADGERDTLCAGATAARTPCGAAPVEAEDSELTVADGVAAGVVSRDVAAVRLRFVGGAPVTVPTTDGPAYTGQFAGAVRFVAAGLPAGRTLRSAGALGADGRRLAGVRVAEPGAVRYERRRFAPGVLLRTATVTEGGRRAVLRCLTRRGARFDAGSCRIPSATPNPVVAAVTCSPRRAVVFGILPRGATAVRVRLAGRAPLTPRIRRVDRLGRAWAVVLPRAATLLGVRAVGARRAEAATALRVPPAARQCGYDAASGS